MKQTLPTILAAGLFQSETRFPNVTVTQPRIANSYELEYFFESGGISVVNGKEYPIKQGNVLLARPGDARYSHLPFTCRFLHFAVSDPILVAALDGIPPVFPVADPKKAEALLSAAISQFYSINPFDNFHAGAALICLLHQLSDQTTQNLSAVAKAQHFIESSYAEPLTTHSIANFCGVSSSYLHKLFKTTLNTTPGEYLLGCRISAAKDLLANSGLPLSEIAFRCGFNSQSYFSDCFKRNVGISPLSFRKNSGYML